MAAELIMRQTTNRLGGAPTSQEVSSTPLNNIFDDVHEDEALSGDEEYAAIDIYNDGDETAAVVSICMGTPTTSPKTQLKFGLDSSHINSVLSIPNESVPPTGVSFAHYDSAAQLMIGTIPMGSYGRVWINRSVDPNALNQRNDIGVIKFRFA